MERDIIGVLQRDFGKFSKGQKKIATFIIENYDKAAFMTAGKLGRTANVSESTVVRFAAELGYDGYPAMRKAMQEMIRNRLTSVQRIEVAEEMFKSENVFESVLCSDMEKIHDTLESCSRDDFDAAVQALINANHVYIIGMRSSACLANFLGYYLNLLLENVRIVQDTTVSEAYEQIIRIKPGDVFVGISYPRYSSRTVKAMKFAKAAGAKVIGITDGENSPFIGLADILLYAKSDMVSFLDSLVAPMSLLNAMIVSVGASGKEDLSTTFTRLESVWKDYEVYDIGED